MSKTTTNPQGGAMDSTTTVRLAQTFTNDHVARLYTGPDVQGWAEHIDCPEARVREVKQNKLFVTLEMTEQALAELAADARYYVTEAGFYEQQDVAQSAERVLAALRKARQ